MFSAIFDILRLIADDRLFPIFIGLLSFFIGRVSKRLDAAGARLTAAQTELRRVLIEHRSIDGTLFANTFAFPAAVFDAYELELPEKKARRFTELKERLGESISESNLRKEFAGCTFIDRSKYISAIDELLRFTK